MMTTTTTIKRTERRGPMTRGVVLFVIFVFRFGVEKLKLYHPIMAARIVPADFALWLVDFSFFFFFFLLSELQRHENNC